MRAHTDIRRITILSATSGRHKFTPARHVMSASTVLLQGNAWHNHVPGAEPESIRAGGGRTRSTPRLAAGGHQQMTWQIMALLDLLLNNMLLAKAITVLALTWAHTALALPASNHASPRSWPDMARASTPQARRELSNADRVRRGLPPRVPERLYDPSRVHSAPKARLSATPPPDTANGYYSQGCWGGIAEVSQTTFYSITAEDDDDALAQCSSYAKADNTVTLVIQYDSSVETYSCWTYAYGAGSFQDCTEDNYAWYETLPYRV